MVPATLRFFPTLPNPFAVVRVRDHNFSLLLGPAPRENPKIMSRFAATSLRRLTTDLFLAAGASATNADATATSLINNDLCGYESHGIMRTIRYIDRIRDGTLQPTAEVAITRNRGANAVVDGGWGFGQVAAQAATAHARELCREFGQAGVSVAHAHHVGRLGEYAESLAADGLVAIVMSAGGGIGGAVAPHGGRQRLLGTNPYAMGVPTPEGEPPLVFDFATSAIAEGKVAVAHANCTPLPPGCLIDRHGQPSVTAADFYTEGALLPFGGHKGYGLMLMIEILASVLADSAPISDPAYRMGNPTLIIALDPTSFVECSHYDAMVAALMERIRTSPPAAGFERVMLPGEPETRIRQNRAQLGIPLSDGVWQQLVTLASELDCTLPNPLATE